MRIPVPESVFAAFLLARLPKELIDPNITLGPNCVKIQASITKLGKTVPVSISLSAIEKQPDDAPLTLYLRIEKLRPGYLLSVLKLAFLALKTPRGIRIAKDRLILEIDELLASNKLWRRTPGLIRNNLEIQGLEIKPGLVTLEVGRRLVT